MNGRRAVPALACAAALLAAALPQTAYALPDWTPALLNHWADRLIPSPSPVAVDGSNVPIPGLLNGAAPTYVSTAYGNLGTTASAGTAGLQLLADGAPFFSAPLPPLAPSVFTATMNAPVTLSAGIHTLGVLLDANAVEQESNELNNGYARQWFFSPNVGLSDGAVVRPQAPPGVGGQDLTPNGTSWIYNADVVQVQPGPASVATSQWQVVAVHGDAGGALLNLYLTDDDETPATVSRPRLVNTGVLAPGQTSFLVQNYAHLPGVNMLAFLERFSGSGPSYVEARLSYPGDLGMNVTLPGNTLAADQMVAVHDLRIAAADTGWVRIDLTQPANAARYLSVLVYAPATVRATRSGANLVAVTDRAGHAWLDVHASVAGSYGVVVARDVADGAPVACSYDIAVSPARPELEFGQPGNWSGPIAVTTDIYATTVPDHADENGPAVIDAGFFNVGHGTFPADRAAMDMMFDGHLLTGGAIAGLVPGSAIYVYQNAPANTAGRHTIRARLNPTRAPENDTGDDVLAAQYAWRPAEMPAHRTFSRPAPPAPAVDWDAIPASSARWPSEDGVRTPVFAHTAAPDSGWWGAIACLPTVTSDDLDLDLHGAAAGLTTGFAQPLRTSGEGAGHIDLALVDVDSGLGPRAVNAGLRWAGTSAAGAVSPSLYACDGSVSVPGGLAQPIVGSIPPVALFQVFDVAPGAPGPVTLVLDKLSAGADLGVAVIARDARPDGIYTLSGARAMGLVADQDVAGASEQLVFTMPSYYYAVVVFRRTFGQFETALPFRLRRADAGALTVGGGSVAPSTVQLSAPSPNPVRDRGAIRFALPAAANVDLAIFDTAGRRVRTLASGAHDAGEHTVTWNGASDDGARLASGLYFARLVAGSERRTEKVTLVQ